MTVVALVLTYSAPEALAACVAAIRAQTVRPAEIVVVDNAGEPPAEDASASTACWTTTSACCGRRGNTGPAGGHAAWLGQLLESAHDLGWVMDDDGPRPECLSSTCSAPAPGPPGCVPVPHADRDGGPRARATPAWSGVLIGRDVVATAGLPNADLFWWAEDTEYLRWRIPASGVPRQLVPEARVRHSRARTPAAHRPAWRYYYEARNTVYLRTRVPGGARCRRSSACSPG